MSETIETNQEIDETSTTKEEFDALRNLFTKGDVEADIEGDSLVLLALVDESYRHRFARIRLLGLAHSVADMMKQQDRQQELLALMGLLTKMQMIVAEYVEAGYPSSFVEVIDEDEFLGELEGYRNPLG